MISVQSCIWFSDGHLLIDPSVNQSIDQYENKISATQWTSLNSNHDRSIRQSINQILAWHTIPKQLLFRSIDWCDVSINQWLLSISELTKRHINRSTNNPKLNLYLINSSLSINQPVNQSINERICTQCLSINQSIHQSINGRSIDQSINGRIGTESLQPTRILLIDQYHQSTDRSNNMSRCALRLSASTILATWSINQSINLPASSSFKQSLNNQSTDLANTYPIDQSINQSTDRRVCQCACWSGAQLDLTL